MENLDVTKPEYRGEILENEINEVETGMVNQYFRWVKGKDGYNLALGNNLVSSEVFKSIREIEKKLKGTDWELLLNVIVGIYHMTNELKK